MQFLEKTKGGLLLLIGLMLLIMAIRFPKIVSEPNQWLMGNSHDGFRSFAAAVYHVKHDSTYSHYEGMHYPYGDIVGFTDNLPLLANSIKFISNNFVDISDFTAGFLNLFMLFSLLLCSLFLYLIFRHLSLPNWFIIPAVIGITLLSPQIGRMSSHYGLAHPFVIPLVFYFSFLFHEKRDVKTSILIAISLFLIGQIHLYLFAIGVLFIVGIMGFKILFRFTKNDILFNVFHLFIQVVLPYIAIKLMINDTIIDRPSRPYGFLEYKSYWENVFLPLDFQIGRWINTYIAEIRPMSGEGKAFVGLVATVFVFKELIVHIKNLVQRKTYFSYSRSSLLFEKCILGFLCFVTFFIWHTFHYSWLGKLAVQIRSDRAV